MKKNVFFFTTAMLFTSVAMSQQWIGLTKKEPAQPEIILNSSNNRQVSFTIELSGFFSIVKTEAGVDYQRLSIPGYGIKGEIGEPEIPVISKRIAVPVCSQVNYSVQITANQTLTGYKVYPTPELQPDTTGKLQEVFTINPTAYLQNEFMPSESYMLSETGAMRNQHFVTIEIYPILFNPRTGTLQIATELEITLTFDNPTTDVNVNTGIFNNVATHTFLNYQDQGIKASINDKAFEKANFTPGNVQWVTLTDTAQAKDIVADYLIICAAPFFEPANPNSEVLRIANHRAWYNGFDVAILNVEHILSDNVGFYYEGYPLPTYKQEQRIRTCIRRIYEGKNAAHTYDGHLGYVLLIGDVSTGTIGHSGMPSAFENTFSDASHDYYFSCVTRSGTGYDKVGDLFIGRFCVPNNVLPEYGLQKLHNMVEKTIYFESECSFGGWRNNVLAGNGYDILPKDFWSNFYLQFLPSVLQNQRLLSLNIHDSIYSNATQFCQALVDSINQGAPYLTYNDHGSPDYWATGITADFLVSNLDNVNKTPLCVTHACLVGKMEEFLVDCLAKRLTHYSPDKGFVAMIASSSSVASGEHLVWSPKLITLFPKAVYQDLSHIAGEAFLESYLQIKNGVGTFNLFGDPALNIMADGFEVTQDIIVADVTDISCQVKVHNNATITVPNQSTVHFHPKGQLIIEADGNLNMGNWVSLYGSMAESNPVIHVKGGISTGSGVVFHDLNGILLGNSLNLSTPWLYNDNKQYSLTNIAFYNTPLTHRGSRLNISKCTFNAGSNLLTSVSKSNIDSCTFNEAILLSDHAMMQINPNAMMPATIVKNCHFNGSGNHNPALQLNYSTLLDIYNNTITGYETGMFLNESGITASYFQNPQTFSRIWNNKISSCGTGIEFYNSIAYLGGNQVYNNISGVRLLNNSYTAFGNDFAPPTSHQIIRDNESYELYASANSFPTIFRYNQIIDEDNLGNDYDDPLIYWDMAYTPPKVLMQNVNFNYWGNNFDPLDDLYHPKLFICDSIWAPGKSTASFLNEDEILYQTGLTSFAEEDYTNAETIFKELIETYPQSHFAIAALHELLALEHFLYNDFETLQNYFASISLSDTALLNTAEFLATRCHVKERNWQPAIDWYEYRIENPPSYQDSVFAVIDLGNIHLMMEADTASPAGAKARPACHYHLADIKPRSRQEYETNRSNLLATLPQIKKPHTTYLMPQTDKKGSLAQSVPNPTTGMTMIPYEIYSEGAVEIRIYSALGQLVQALPQGMLKKGGYQTKISFAEFPAGIYHYVLFVNGERTDAKKMVVN